MTSPRIFAMSIAGTRKVHDEESGKNYLELATSAAYVVAKEAWQAEVDACITVVPDNFPVAEGWDDIDIDLEEIQVNMAKMAGGCSVISVCSTNQEQALLWHRVKIIYSDGAGLDESIQQATDEALIEAQITQAGGWVKPSISWVEIEADYLTNLEAVSKDGTWFK